VRHYLTLVVGLLAVFLALFAVVEAVGLPLLTDPSAELTGAGPVAAASLGVGLLIADVVLPAPSRVVMVAHGAVFGVVVGTLLSVAGSVGAALVGFAVGRHGGQVLDRLVPESERQRADALLGRWGALAVVVTRPVPMLAETTAVLAGATPTLSWRRATLAAVIGSFPAAMLYAVAGAAAAGIANVTLVFGLVLALASVTWFVEWAGARRAAHFRLADRLG
jgi:uncharacterized membrane protein YdjX (TVP38/TMEM64 family)